MIHIYLEAETENELNIKIDNYFKEYPSAGYGTSFGKIKFNESKSTFEVKGTRGRSCD
jgi:hypothetical protein